MTFRSRLFATVALPVLSAALIATPTLADALTKPFEVAQESTDQAEPTDQAQPADQAQPSEEELLQQQQDDAQRAADEEAQRAAEEQKAAEEAERAGAEQKAAEEEAQRAAQEEQQAAEEAEKAAAEQKAADDEAQRAAQEEQKAAEEAERAAAEQKAAEDEAQRASQEEQKAAEDAEKAAAEQKAADDEAQRAAQDEQQRQAEEQKAAEEQKQAEEPAQTTTGEQPAVTEGEQPVVTEGEKPAVTEGEQPAVTGEETPAETGTQQPSTAETGETPVAEPVPEVVETMTEEQKQEIAKDPGQTDETVVLPVENGAAVLDSDKDADKAGGQMSREQRRKQREELRAQEEIPVPESDDGAQAAISAEVREAVSSKIEAGNREEGRRVKKAPEFEVPDTTNIINNTVINNTIVNNNTVNNTTIDNSVTEVNVIERIENRTVLEVGNQLIVRGDDRPRLRRDSEEVYYDNLARGRVRETIVRPGGVQIVTIYNRYGDIIQRSRLGRDGQEYILVYAPELEGDAPRPGLVDVGFELPPMRLRIPVSDYIIDTSSDPDRDYYEFLSEPPVERVERVYSIDEVKQSARLRDKVRRIDLDTITFATGSAEVPMSQARTLRSVADAMQKVLDKDPGETFLIEGHTDAVGSDKSNLLLSDERAESVASLLTDVYGVPPENLQTQGYGERFLKVRIPTAEQQNRRVTIRRVTTLVRPVARAN